MPEGPSLVILSEELQRFRGKTVLTATGRADIDMDRLSGRKIRSIGSHGKHLLIQFSGFFVRIHLLMFGTWRINEERNLEPRLQLQFKKDLLSFYTCSVKLIDGAAADHYDPATDVMSSSWDVTKAVASVKALGAVNVCDALLNQEIFAGVGNIIKNEVLFRCKIHPLSLANKIPARKKNQLIKEASLYSHDFYKWKKQGQLKKNWLIYKKKECPRCYLPATKDYIGKSARLTCYCGNCQILYN